MEIRDILLHDLAISAPSFPNTDMFIVDPIDGSTIIYCLIHRSQRHQDFIYRVYSGEESFLEVHTKFVQDIEEKFGVQQGFVSLINIDNIQ